jgi:hypothetical protein
MSGQEPPDHSYRRLEVSPAASREDIVRAYRRLALVVHPDACPEDPEASRRFPEITEAYEILAEARDACPRRGTAMASSPGSAAPPSFPCSGQSSSTHRSASTVRTSTMSYAHDALQVLVDESFAGRWWIVETDIANCFTAIPHNGLMQAV